MNLSSSTNNITITLLGAALKSGGSFQYQYRLLGTDSSWVHVKASENQVRFTSLPSGKYIFEARVLNEDGIVSANTASIHFSIEEYWWKKWWFILFLLLLVVGAGIYFSCLGFVFWKRRIRKKQKK